MALSLIALNIPNTSPERFNALPNAKLKARGLGIVCITGGPLPRQRHGFISDSSGDGKKQKGGGETKSMDFHGASNLHC
jgi:hypothetical protein